MDALLFAVRPLLEEDAEATSELISNLILSLEYYSPEARHAEIRKYTPDRLRRAITEDPASVLVAVSNDEEIVGFCANNFDDGLVWLAWFGVHPDWRRAGVGRALLHALENTIPARGAHKIWCDCRTTNDISARLLTSFGFKKICTVTNHWYGHDFFLLEKVVDGS
jgi:ribosomal protein S18 acetylase RimI-like enzyme